MDESLIEKFLFNFFSPLASNESKLWAELQGQFQIQLNESMQPYFDKVMEILDRLQQEHILIVDSLPGRMPSIRKGVLFGNWAAKMTPQKNTPNSIKIGSLNAENVQVGNDNVFNVGAPIKEFAKAVEMFANKPEKEQKTNAVKIIAYVTSGATLVSALIALIEFLC